MAAASCVQEEKEEKEIQEPSDTIAQGNYVIKLPTLSHIACKHATGKYFATHRRRTRGECHYCAPCTCRHVGCMSGGFSTCPAVLDS